MLCEPSPAGKHTSTTVESESSGFVLKKTALEDSSQEESTVQTTVLGNDFANLPKEQTFLAGEVCSAVVKNEISGNEESDVDSFCTFSNSFKKLLDYCQYSKLAVINKLEFY